MFNSFKNTFRNHQQKIVISLHINLFNKQIKDTPLYLFIQKQQHKKSRHYICSTVFIPTQFSLFIKTKPHHRTTVLKNSRTKQIFRAISKRGKRWKRKVMKIYWLKRKKTLLNEAFKYAYTYSLITNFICINFLFFWKAKSMSLSRKKKKRFPLRSNLEGEKKNLQGNPGFGKMAEMKWDSRREFSSKENGVRHISINLKHEKKKEKKKALVKSRTCT